MRWCICPPSTTVPFIVSRGSEGTYRQCRRLVEQTWAPDGVVGVPAGVGYHRLLIVGPWLGPKRGYLDSTCEELVRKAVVQSVELLQVYDSGPMDPSQSNIGH